jgi:hypothetical protein
LRYAMRKLAAFVKAAHATLPEATQAERDAA